jgi:hypothetical protein
MSTAIRVNDEWHPCRISTTHPLRSAAINGTSRWSAPESHGAVEPIVSAQLDVPVGDCALRLNGKEMAFKVNLQKLTHVWGDVIPSKPPIGS